MSNNTSTLLALENLTYLVLVEFCFTKCRLPVLLLTQHVTVLPFRQHDSLHVHYLKNIINKLLECLVQIDEVFSRASAPGKPVKLSSAVFKVTHCTVYVVTDGKAGLGIISYFFITHCEKVAFGASFPCKCLVTPVASNLSWFWKWGCL